MERRLAAILAADMVGFSRLVEKDQDNVLSRQKAHRADLIDPQIAQHRGRIVKTTGDGLLVEFASAQDAVRCAIDVQVGMVAREHGQTDDARIQYRIGINLGDVVFDDGDVFGDGVNVAARLEGLAPPGGVIASDIVHQTVLDRIAEPFRDMGAQRVKNISRPIRAWQWAPDAKPAPEPSAASKAQRVRYCTSADGTSIAYASVGAGPPVLKAPNWLNHIEYEWQSPVWGPMLTEFTRDNQLVRFDQRGNGLSDWDVETISPDAMIADMEAVVAASGLDRFALFGISQGAGFSVRYAVEHPEQITCLVLFGGYPQGRLARNDPEETRMHEASKLMIREGWGSPNPVYRNFFTSAFVPDAPRAVQDSFDEIQRMSTNTENALRLFEMNARVDTSALARQVRVPTLVLHNKGDRMVPIAQGRALARLIPDATFVELPGTDHALVEGGPGFDRFFDEVRAFLKDHDA